MEEPQRNIVKKRVGARNHGIVGIHPSLRHKHGRPARRGLAPPPTRNRALIKHKQRSLKSTKRNHRRETSRCIRSKLNGVVVVVKLNVPGPLPVPADELLVARRAFVLGVARQHALQAHAHALDVLDGAPPLLAEEVEADDAVGVDVRVHRDGSVGGLDKGYLGGLCAEWLALALGGCRGQVRREGEDAWRMGSGRRDEPIGYEPENLNLRR